MKIGGFFFPHFAVQVETRNDSSIAGKPIIIGGLPYERKFVYDTSQKAREFGIKQGMPLREAYSLCPRGLFLPLDEERYTHAFTAVLTLLADYSPVVEAGTLGSALIDLGYEKDKLKSIRELRQLIETSLHLHSSVSIASNRFVARVASQIARPGEVIIVPDGEEGEFLKDLSVRFLPASAKTLEQLELLGIYWMGQLASLPPEAVSMEFGGDGRWLWELSNGVDGSRLIPWTRAPMLKEQAYFEPAAESINQLLARSDELLGRLSQQLKERWQCCLRLTISLHFTNGHVVQRVIHFKEATSCQETMLHHLKQCLERARFTAPVSEMRLTATDFCPESGKQTLFVDEPLQRRQMLAPAVSWLRRRYGKGIVKKIVTKPDSVLPENSFYFTEFSV
jgi:DNA polymerase-4